LRRKLLYAGEIAGVVSIATGVGLIYFPAALILLGILAVVGFERALTMQNRPKGAKK
jgi:hypothetical protein